ncbi:MAG TPA: hypothetical protein DIU35_19555 [Candidatus Latescibacteria bacterium]|mgnify:CR=1 FL=1|nr:hypothetical protein [Candidatus Latescibacterota bacterium]|tara:strand:- start:8183 stop:9358 length:1176 start_codon:yes stop_codon:yes gene_type:complete
MNVAFVTAAEIPSRWANSIQVIKMAQGFRELGHDVDLITAGSYKQWKTDDSGPIWEHYGVSTPFTLSHLPLRPLLKLEKKLDCGRLSYGYLVSRWKQRRNVDLVFARNYIAPYWSAKLGIPTIAESHADVDNFYQKHRLFEAARLPSFRALVTISDRLAADYAEAGVPTNKIIVEQDGVDLSLFKHTDPSQVQGLRKSLLRHKRAIVLYAGHLYDYKGIPTILNTAEILTDVSFILVGGWEHDIERVQQQVTARKLGNVHLQGFVPNRNIPAYLKAADILLLPNSAEHAQSHTTSPLKLFEYMASGTPIVASEIQNVKHVLRQRENAVLFQPDNAHSLAEGIETSLKTPEDAARWASHAETDAHQYSWSERVRRIIEFARLDQDPIHSQKI